MKVSNIKDIDKFFSVVDSCEGRVELVTGEGDRLNLKSKLSQYVSLANIFSGGEIPELEIVAYEKDDIDKLMSFMINGRSLVYTGGGMMVNHAPFFDVNRQVVLKVLNSCRIFVNQGAQAFPGQSALMADLNTLDILCIMSTLQVNI